MLPCPWALCFLRATTTCRYYESIQTIYLSADCLRQIVQLLLGVRDEKHVGAPARGTLGSRGGQARSWGDLHLRDETWGTQIFDGRTGYAAGRAGWPAALVGWSQQIRIGSAVPYIEVALCALLWRPRARAPVGKWLDHDEHGCRWSKLECSFILAGRKMGKPPSSERNAQRGCP